MKVIEGNIGSKFGMRIHPITGQKALHNGIDIAAPIGTPIYAPSDGTVEMTYTHATGGITLIMVSADGATRYGFCHLSGYAHGASKGNKITQGQLIAHSGNTGRSTGPHLHYTVKMGGRLSGGAYQGGDFVDPAPFVEIK